MTKYCEACHTANKDNARRCVGCAGKFNGVRTPALLSLRAELEERQELASPVDLRPDPPPCPISRAAVPAAVTRAQSDPSPKTFARTAAGSISRTLPKARREAAVRSLGRASPRIVARGPQRKTKGVLANTASPPVHDGRRQAELPGIAHATSFPLVPIQRTQAGGSIKSKRWVVLVPLIALPLTATLVMKSERMSTIEEAASGATAQNEPRLSVLSQGASADSGAKVEPASAPELAPMAPVAAGPTNASRSPPVASAEEDAQAALAAARSPMSLQFDTANAASRPLAKGEAVEAPSKLDSDQSRASSSTPIASEPRAQGTARVRDKAPKPRLAARGAASGPQRVVVSPHTLGTQRTSGPEAANVESASPAARPPMPGPAAQASRSGSGSGPCDRYNPFGEAICVNSPPAASASR